MERFVGRARELEVLREQLAAARAGRGQVTLLAGEPGIGKTRLAQEFAAEADVPTGWGRASEDEGSPPYWVFRQALRSLDLDLPELLSSRVAESSPEARFTAFDAVGARLGERAASDGLLVVLDDLHWADPAALSLFAHLARTLDRSRVMLLASYRDTETTGREALTRTLAAVAHEPGLRRLRLVGLTAEEVGRQLAAITGSAVPPELAGRVSRRTGGNPFFVAEVGRLAPEGTDALPDAVLDTVRIRLAQLGDSCRHLVATAATLGSDLDPAALSRVVDRPIESVLRDLDTARTAGLVTGGDAWRFAHDLIREAARSDLATADRLTAHARFAEWLVGRPDGPGRAAAIAHHLLASLPVGDGGRAGEWAERAGDEALEQFAWEDAAHLYQRALRADANLAPEARGRLLRRHAVALLRSGEMLRGYAALNAAADAARAAGAAEELGRVALEVEGVSDAWGSFQGGPVAQDALALLPVEDSPLRARLMALVAAEAALSGGVQPERMSAEALAMAERLADERALQSALHARQMVRAGPDGVFERLALGDRMVAIGRDGTDDNAAFWGHLWRFDALVMLGRLDDAEAELGPIDHLATRLRRAMPRLHGLRSHAAIDVARGRFSDAVAATLRSMDLVGQRGHDALAGVSITVLATIASLTGQEDLLTDEMLDVVHRDAPAFVRSVFAQYWLRMGDLERADRYYRQGISGGPIPVPAALSLRCTCVEVAARLGRTEDAAQAERQLRPHAELFATGGAGALLVAGSVRTYLGMAAAACGRPDDAVRDLRAAIVANEAAGTPPFTALAQFELARVLARRRRPGDVDEATALAATCRARADRLGMAPLRRDADELQHSLSPGGAGALTRREREVAQHVAQGLTNKQIAALLHISERTAESHVQHVLTKLGLANRTQLAARLATETIRTEGP